MYHISVFKKTHKIDIFRIKITNISVFPNCAISVFQNCAISLLLNLSFRGHSQLGKGKVPQQTDLNCN